MNEAAGGVVVIGWPQLLLATGFVVFVGVVSIRLSLGITRTSRSRPCAPTCSCIALGLRAALGVRHRLAVARRRPASR